MAKIRRRGAKKRSRRRGRTPRGNCGCHKGGNGDPNESGMTEELCKQQTDHKWDGETETCVEKTGEDKCNEKENYEWDGETETCVEKSVVSTEYPVKQNQTDLCLLYTSPSPRD